MSIFPKPMTWWNWYILKTDSTCKYLYLILHWMDMYLRLERRKRSFYPCFYSSALSKAIKIWGEKAKQKRDRYGNAPSVLEDPPFAQNFGLALYSHLHNKMRTIFTSWSKIWQIINFCLFGIVAVVPSNFSRARFTFILARRSSTSPPKPYLIK